MRLSAKGDATPGGRDTGGGALLVALGAALFALLWLTEIVGDPTEGALFYTLIFAAPLLIASGLVLLPRARS